MPNWCDNSVTITHTDKSKIDAIEATLQLNTPTGNDCQLFNTILPRPESEEENWYDWNVHNWGTKWDAQVIDWERNDDNEIWISFASAWSPPSALYEYMDDNGYDVRALYCEPGMGFAGRFVDGEEQYYEYDISDQESIDELPGELIDFADLQAQHDDWVEQNEEETE